MTHPKNPTFPPSGMSGREAFESPDGENLLEQALDSERDEATILELSLQNYEGPLELLLDLARKQKVDLKEISMSALVDQYIYFVEKIKKHHIDIAAEYLVMASWLTYLKSLLLLPNPDGAGDEPPEAMMARRALILLDAMRIKSQELFSRHQRGVDFFFKGMEETLPEEVTVKWESDVNLLINAYAESQNSKPIKKLDILPTKLVSPQLAIDKLKKSLPFLQDWTGLGYFLEHLAEFDCHNELEWRAALSSCFFASLELTRQGVIEIRPERNFYDIAVRSKDKNNIH